MNVKLAKSAGFCFGVKRAVNMVYDRIGQTDMPIYTYGPIIHNEEVVKDMESKGVHVVEDLSDLATLPKGIIIIRSHGISKSEYDQMQEAGFEIVDATCPFVLKIHRLVREYSMKGHYIIIVGNENHPEVQGIRGWVEESGVSIIATKEDADNFALPDAVPVTIVSQTTFNYNKFQELVEIITKKGYDINVLNTICNATEERQTEARSIAKESDAMIVIGGKSSSNTQKLFEICKNECANTYYIQTSSDMDYTKLRSINNVGITAGASTPNNIIEEVSKNVRNEL
ncbi:4-hydroxy-3-methylbut-2-enyl diphosphate reductase [Roseburia sp. MUC/MUC-530-WT-4D]|uniref:4-hydroxy-3-methylbut-2-enyl diphosphate reductase n=1 Tax=Roseburia porci TaxID=2605790 RepID=A0A6L5YQ21_9FIRM|nr:4-hydroxy-3-methylbut-2-enyl diphosphate reductase [Roseburia porci]MCI5517124.1 4-hydroxy-3-methylbut-2-enyl diphosphate reductase [Roseburia sp.]MST74049.1 4-hydroxy-3-methylbut-2-enyl diphosphate reductase [Roseburia porci]